MKRFRFLIVAMLLMLITLPGAGPLRTDPTCNPNIRYPRRPENTCGEAVVSYDFVPGIASITALAFGPDGLLYFARPVTSEIVRLRADASGVISARKPDPQVFASNLPEPPNGLTYYDGAWYVSGDTTITRVRDTNGDGTADDQQVIVRDLPGSAGGWLGNLHVGPDKRLYVAKGASCDACTESDPRRAALLSFALDGSDPRIVATGLRDSYDFAWDASGDLYIVDNERPDLPAELNMIPHGETSAAPPDFGWPRCDSNARPIQNLPADITAGDCSKTVKPAALFPIGSHPMGMAAYNNDAFPEWKGGMLVALGGSWNALETTGYSVWLVRPGNQKALLRRVIPDPANTFQNEANAALYYLSFYPDHLVGVAISPEGWLYVSLREGRIIRFRPYKY